MTPATIEQKDNLLQQKTLSIQDSEDCFALAVVSVIVFSLILFSGADLRGGCRGMRTPSPRDDLRFSNTTGILQKKTMWFIGVEVEQETSAPSLKKKSWIRPCFLRLT